MGGGDRRAGGGAVEKALNEGRPDEGKPFPKLDCGVVPGCPLYPYEAVRALYDIW